MKNNAVFWAVRHSGIINHHIKLASKYTKLLNEITDRAIIITTAAVEQQQQQQPTKAENR